MKRQLFLFAASIALALMLFLFAPTGRARGIGAYDELSEKAKQVHFSSLLVDGHNDLPWRLREESDLTLSKFDLTQVQSAFHTDIPRLRRGGMGAQFWSAYVPASLMQTGTAVQVTLEQIDLIHRLTKKYSATFEMASSTDDVRRIHRKGKIASLIGVEGGHSIDNSLEILRELYRRGTRYMTLTHSKNLAWVESATDVPMPDPLTPFGEEVVKEMNTLGMLVDISHISARAMREVLQVARAPVIASHSSAYALKNHPRNVPDDVLKTVATNGGVIMVNFYPAFIADETEPLPVDFFTLHGARHDCVEEDVAKWRRDNRLPKADLKRVVDHIDHIASVAGIDHVGLGSDFDGVPTLPEGLEDVSRYPYITEELLRRGYSTDAIRKVLGENVMRAFKRVEEEAAKRKLMVDRELFLPILPQGGPPAE